MTLVDFFWCDSSSKCQRRMESHDTLECRVKAKEAEIPVNYLSV